MGDVAGELWPRAMATCYQSAPVLLTRVLRFLTINIPAVWLYQCLLASDPSAAYKGQSCHAETAQCRPNRLLQGKQHCASCAIYGGRSSFQPSCMHMPHIAFSAFWQGLDHSTSYRSAAILVSRWVLQKTRQDTILDQLFCTMQAVIHCEIVRQAARVVAMDRERLRSGDRACVRFRFLQRPEYLTAGTRFVFREGRTKGIGMVMGLAEGPM